MKYEYLNDDYWPDVYWPKHYWPYGLPHRQLQGDIVNDTVLMGIMNQAVTVLVGAPSRDNKLFATEVQQLTLRGSIVVTPRVRGVVLSEPRIVGQLVIGD